MLNLLDESLIRIRRTSGAAIDRVSLPELLVLLADDAVASFPALRAHQRFAWHAFLVQLAAIALHRARRAELPTSAEAWADLLRALTPDYPDDAPWCLVAPHDRPALLQAVVPGGAVAAFKPVPSPDALDMLVTSRNHDLKRAAMLEPEPDDWLMALVSLQTQEGVMGAGKYGVARMNSGYGSRGFFTVRPPGGPGAWFRRDLGALLAGRGEILRRVPVLRAAGGIGLVWLEPWPEGAQLTFDRLDPFFIEVCRRVRLCLLANGRLSALESGSSKARIAAKELAGVTGDPWAPIDVRAAKCFSITGTGFNYRVVTRLLSSEYQKPVLAEVQENDADEGLKLVAASVARGGGKTSGYHERSIPISKTVKCLLFAGAADQIAAVGHERVELVGRLARGVLRPALYCLLRDGKEAERLTPKQRQNLDRQADGWLERLDREVDATFFPDLWREIETEDEVERELIRNAWLRDLIERAAAILGEASRAVPLASIHRYRARTRAKGRFRFLAKEKFPQLYAEGTHAAADTAA